MIDSFLETVGRRGGLDKDEATGNPVYVGPPPAEECEHLEAGKVRGLAIPISSHIIWFWGHGMSPP